MATYQSPWGDMDETVQVRENVPGKETNLSGFGGHSRTIFWIIGIFAVLLIGGVYYFYFYANQPAALALAMTKPDRIFMGAPFTISVSLTNTSAATLTDVRVSLALPNNLSFVGQPTGRRSLEQVAGDLNPGAVGSQSFAVIATGGSESLAHLVATATYGSAGSSSRFEGKQETDLLIGPQAVDIKLGVPQSAFNGKDFDFTVNYTNNAGQDFGNFKIDLGYPDGFQFAAANVSPASGTQNEWAVGTLASGQSGSIVVTGALTGTEGVFYPINATTTAEISGTEYPMGGQSVNIPIAYAPLSVSITLADRANSVVAPGNTLHYVLTYKNNSPTTFQGVTITAHLSGALYDLTTMRTNAAVDSLNKTLRWFAANTPSLGSVAPGEGGTVDFMVALAQNYPIKSVQDKNFILGVNVQIDSQTLPSGTQAGETSASSSIQNKVQGMIALVSRGLWRDAVSGIVNKGPYPPRVNQPTRYTIHWILKNYATDVVNMHVSAQLESATRFTGIVKSNVATTPKYDPTTGTVTWDIPYLPANRGVLNTPPEAIFQIENVPSADQIGFRVPLISTVQAQAQDVFTGATLLSTVPELTTDLPDDKTISPTLNRTVQQ